MEQLPIELIETLRARLSELESKEKEAWSKLKQRDAEWLQFQKDHPVCVAKEEASNEWHKVRSELSVLQSVLKDADALKTNPQAGN